MGSGMSEPTCGSENQMIMHLCRSTLKYFGEIYGENIGVTGFLRYSRVSEIPDENQNLRYFSENPGPSRSVYSEYGDTRPRYFSEIPVLIHAADSHPACEAARATLD